MAARPGNASIDALDCGVPAEDASVEKLLPEVYDELHSLAERYLFGERRDHTLQPTALIHEVYLKLSANHQPNWNDRSHFVAIAARAMREVLVNHAIRHKAQKRGGDWREVALDEALTIFEDRSVDLLALNEALQKLAEIDPRQARIVELRFFGGLGVRGVAQVLNLGVRTIVREWRVARAWLRREVGAS